MKESDSLFKWVLIAAVGAILIGGIATAVTVSRQTYAPAPPAAKTATTTAGAPPVLSAPDGEPPRVLATVPIADAKAVDACAFVRARFSEEIDPQSVSPGSFAVETAGGTRVPGGVSASGATAHFTPLVPFTKGEEYIARLGVFIKDSSGTPLAQAVTWRFTAGACGSGSTYFVAMPDSPTRCSDDWAGTRAKPFCSLSKAVNSVQPGDVIAVREGTYVGTNISKAGTDDAWIRMRAFDNEKVVVRGTGRGPSIYFYTDRCDQYSDKPCEPVYWVLEGLTVRGSPHGEGDGNAVKIDTPRVKLVRNTLCCAVADVVKLVRTSNDVELIGNEIYQDAAIVPPSKNAQGIDIVGADRARVSFNYVHDVPDIGVYAKGNARVAIFENNRVARVGVHGLMLGQSTDADRLVDGSYETYDGLMRNNVVIDTGWSCLAVSSSLNARVYHNSCYNVGKGLHGAVLLSNESEVKQTSARIDIRNNLIVAAGTLPTVRITSDAMRDYGSLHIDNNLYARVDGSGELKFRCSNCLPGGGAMEAADIKRWRGTMGQDIHTRIDPPGLASTDTLALSAESPARDAAFGLLVAEDYAGEPRPQGVRADIGAHEFKLPAEPMPAPTTPTKSRMN